jgi:hypothetical protein
MLISAAIFAYFGFATGWAHQYTTTTPPVLIPMVVVLKWTLRGGAVAFALSAALTWLGAAAGPALYAAAGLATAVLFLAVAIWEWTNPAGYVSGVPAILLVIFALWNGFASWQSMRDLVESRRRRPAAPRDTLGA